MFHVPNKYRIRTHPTLATTDANGNNGAFMIPELNGRDLWIIASDGTDWDESGLEGPPWEHVSVHAYQNNKFYTPRWDEMCKVKELFWDDEDVVIQFHPRKSEYINNHPNTLHLWRPIGINIPMPPTITIGLK